MAENAVVATDAAKEAAPAQAQEQVVAQKKGKAKVASTGNYIQDVAIKVEALSKGKALSTALELFETIESSFFELGGVLALIKNNQWYDGLDKSGQPYKNFSDYVSEKFDFKVRKADYLIEIYEALVTQDIPWEKVKDLGWTKLSMIAKLLTPENVDDWVSKATPLTVAELKLLLSPQTVGADGTSKPTSDIVIKKFSLHSDQNVNVTEALQKAKVALSTDADNVALDAICIGYVGNTTSIPSDVAGTLKEMGIEKAIEMFNDTFPEYTLELGKVGEEAAGDGTEETAQ